ncbi:DUF4347 domain-containing protein [Arvimicrobium flavum]|uniref:DUF4347 domain-containing protein n=1 Tax=Arvimicrobium flavum TaxID=3393320 RepID=UPI00237ACC96|nr:DUF4347 domain-containing protein [Mesorhizobium shangrilense]
MKTVVIVDGALADVDALLSSVSESAEIVRLEPGTEGLGRIAGWAMGKAGYEAMHVLSHGQPGAILLGGRVIDGPALDESAKELASIGEALAPGADILLYGCETGADAAGRSFIDRFAAATGANVAASSSKVGSAELGGCWDLDVRTQHGEIHLFAPPAALAAYPGLLAVKFTEGADPLGQINSGSGEGRMVFGDFDGDGNIDVLYQSGNTAGSGFGYFRNNGDGTFFNYTNANSAGTPFVTFNFSGQQLNSLFVVDYDNDGDVDIIDRDPAGGLAAWRNDNGAFTLAADPLGQINGGSGEGRMIAGDFDSDGDVDFLYQAGNTPGSGFGYLQNNGSGSFTNVANANTAGTPFATADFSGQLMTTLSLYVVDYDGDGDLDILDRDNTGGGANTIGAWRNDNGAFTRVADPLGLINAGVAEGRMQFGDFDSDGDIDILYQAGNTAGVGFGYIRNDGSSFTTLTNANAAGTPFAGFDFAGQQLTNLFVVDYDNDGDLDILDRDPAGGLGVWIQGSDSGGDGSPPVIVSTTPADDATNVSPTANLVVTFDEAVTKGSGNIYIVRLSDNVAVQTIAVTSAQVTGSGTTWTIDPPADLAASTYYGVRIEAGAFVDMDGAIHAGITDATQFSFITGTSALPPIIANLSGDSVAFTENGPAVLLDAGSNATVTDGDSANFSGGALTVSIVANGNASEDVLGFAAWVSLSAGMTVGSVVSVSGEQVGTITANGISGNALVVSLNSAATPARVQELVRALTYANADGLDPGTATRSVQVTLSDGAGGTSAAQTVTVVVAAVNDAPVVTVPGNISVTEDVASAVTGISFSDVDAGSANVTVTLSVPSGSLSATSGGGVTVGGTASALTLTGSIANINAFIAASNLAFTTAANATGEVTLTVSIDDGGNTGSGGTQTDSATVPLQVSAVNDAPTITAPTTIAVDEDVAKALSGISFADVDAGSGAVTATFSVPSGALAATSGGGVTVGGTGSALTLTGSIANINAFVAAGGVSFTTAANATADVTLTVTIDDGGNTGTGSSLTASTTVTLDVSAVNDAPVNTVPTAQDTDKDVGLVFSSGNLNLISISDVDAGSGSVEVTLTATNGVLSLSGVAGLTFSAGDGTGDGMMKFQGTVADINAALNGLTFTPTADHVGAASIEITTDDLGMTGGAALTDTDTIDITVNQVGPEVVSVQATSPDGGYKAGDTITLTMTFDQIVTVNGTPTLLLETGATDRVATYSGGSGTDTLTFTYTVLSGDVSADLDYQSASALALNGATIQSADSGRDAVLTLPAPGGANSIGGQSNIVVDTVAPAVTSVGVPASATYVAGQNLDFTVNFSEAVTVDTSSGTPRIAITLDTGGTVYADYLSGSGTGALVFRYTVAAGQQDMTGISVGAAIDANGGSIADATGNAAVTPLNSVGSTVGVRVDAVNDAPVFSGVGPAVTAVEQTWVLLDSNISVFDSELAAASNYRGSTLTLMREGGANADDSFGFDLPAADYLAANGVITALNGRGDFATYSISGGVLTVTFAGQDTNVFQPFVDAVLRHITYQNTSDAPPASVVLEYAFADGNQGQQGSGGSQTGTAQITVNITPVNDAPVLAGLAPVSFVEDADAVRVAADATISDVDLDPMADSNGDYGGATLTITLQGGGTPEDVLSLSGAFFDNGGILTDGDNDFGTITNAGGVLTIHFTSSPALATSQVVNSVLRSITYANTSDTPPGGVQLLVAFNDGSGAADGTVSHLVDVAITATNDTPVFANVGPAVTTVEQAAPVVLDADITVSDPELDAANGGSGDYAGASLTVSRQGGASADDQFSLVSGPGFSVTGGAIDDGNGQTVATFTSTGGVLTINFTSQEAPATSALVDAIIRSVSYTNSSDAPPASVVLEYAFADGNQGAQGGGGLATGVAQITVNITPVEDAPTGAPTTVLANGTEDTPYVVSVADLLLGFSDPDGDALSIANLASSVGTVTDNGDNTFTIALPANFNGAVNLTYDVIDGNGGVLPATQGFAVAPVSDDTVIGGAVTGQVVEAAAGDPGTPTATGSLTAADPDNPAAGFAPIAAGTRSIFGYGAFEMTAGGTWTYTLDNAHPKVDGLAAGETLTDRFVVTAADGTPQLIVVTIVGADDGGTTAGTSGNDRLVGASADDILNGLGGDDVLEGRGGNDLLNGGRGLDTAFFAGDLAGYQLTRLADGTVEIVDIDPADGDDGTDILSGIELLQFGSAAPVTIGSLVGQPDWSLEIDDVALVAATWQLFMGALPTEGGFEFLVLSQTNPTDLNDPYYAGFNLENLYLNFAANLATGNPDGIAWFAAEYGDLSYEAAVQKAFAAIVTSGAHVAAGSDPAVALAFFLNAESFFEQVAMERVAGPGVDLDDAAKIVMLGSMLYEAVRSDLGPYGEAVNDFAAIVQASGQAEDFGGSLFAVA